MSTGTSASPSPPVAMQCMEIRGGSQAVEESVAVPGLDLWVSSHPHEGDSHGGDVHYISLCGGGVITRLIIADVSGHGERVAEFSSSLRNLMRKNINIKKQTGLVRSLNRQFAAMAQLRRFATAVVATYLATRRQLTVCNAGHPRPFWYRASTGRWEVLERRTEQAGDLPLGIDDEARYHQFTLELGPGDAVLFYTDALTEAADASGRLLGEEGLLTLAQNLAAAAPREFGRALLSAVERHREGRPPDDDTTLLVLHHNAGGPKRLSLREKVDVYAKVFGVKSY
ncbi:MAG: PP2C family protein-serine/threonine phosphatase [Isosphaeraceae bacterium]|nr:PP2C family protein-serine/threonine phosphatase [Isosphaeraceae bacterium]